jgi:NADPH:quinone reductase-like Zn-dependent oxidoreductase
MVAVRVHAFGAEPLVDDVPEPRPAAGESLVEILAANVEPLDLDVLAGEFPVLPPLPYVPGVAGTGRVLESSAFQPGDMVQIDGADVGIGRDGTWAQRMALPDAALSILPSGVEPIAYTAFAGSFVAAHLAIVDLGALRPGERVVVTGAAGNVGSLAVRLALARDAGAVVGSVSRAERRPDVPTGAVAVVGPDQAAAALGGSADLLIDTVGGDRLQDFIDLVAPGGRACLVGYMAGKIVTLDLPRLLVADVRLLPINSMGWRERSTADPIGALRSGQFTVHRETHGLRCVTAALARLRAGRVRGRVVLVPDAGSEPRPEEIVQ